MAETLNISILAGDDGTYVVEVNESWSRHTVRGPFVPPYTARQMNAIQKKLNSLECRDKELRDIGYKLFRAICAVEAFSRDQSLLSLALSPVQSVLQGAIQRTLKRRGTVALTLIFGRGCEEFVRYPWELLHNGDHFLLVSGVFTLSRALLRPDVPVSGEFPVHPPFRVLYIGSSPANCTPLETERSFSAMEQALAPLIDIGQVLLDRLEPPTFGQLVRYLTSYGGAGLFDDSDTMLPCYIIHFDGHGAYGRLCSQDECETMNDVDARKCCECGVSLARVKPQTYLCFCDEEGMNSFIDTQSLRDLLLSSDIRLAVLSACETAHITEEHTPSSHYGALDSTLATALVTAQIPAVVAMPFSLQDDLSPTFMYHFYEALASGRTLEESLTRARQAMLPMQQKSWFIPVLYRHLSEKDEGPVPFMASSDDDDDEYVHPFTHLNPASVFVGREQELYDLDLLLSAAASGPLGQHKSGNAHIRPFYHHILLTGSVGIGKSALAFEAIRRHRDKFQGGVIGISLQGGKLFADALIEMIQHLHIPTRNIASTDVAHRMRLVQGTLRSLAGRDLPCLLLLDSFDEIKDRAELETWLQFLSSLPVEVTVVVTSRTNPTHLPVVGGSKSHWYEYSVDTMKKEDLFHLCTELAALNGLDQRIQLENSRQQHVLHEICELLDGYPLGAELIFGTARFIGGAVYTPEAATRSLEEIRDELKNMPLAGILAMLELSYLRLSRPAQMLLSYLSAFTLPFQREQIIILITAEHLALEPRSQGATNDSEMLLLANKWRPARDELVQSSFMQFDGHLYTIHAQTRHFAFALLSPDERRRAQRIVASYYAHLPQANVHERIASFKHFEAAAEDQDKAEAIQVILHAVDELKDQGYVTALQAMLRRAILYAQHLGDLTGEARLLQCLESTLCLEGTSVDVDGYANGVIGPHQ